MYSIWLYMMLTMGFSAQSLLLACALSRAFQIAYAVMHVLSLSPNGEHFQSGNVQQTNRELPKAGFERFHETFSKRS
jgi:hypothetical protein